MAHELLMECGIENCHSQYSFLPEDLPAIDQLVEECKSYYLKLWWELDTSFSLQGPCFDAQRKIANERETNSLIDRLAAELKAFPQSEQARAEWARMTKINMRQAGLRILELPGGVMDILLQRDFSEATRAFIAEARAFNQDLEMIELLQAIRNVWIMNYLQLLLRLPVQSTPSVFAYSMLYPYTDNFLDRVDINAEAKRSVSLRFRQRLAFGPVEPRNTYEKQLYALVQLIESEYPRTDYPQIYRSLLAIHDAQQKSLQQQEGDGSPYDRDILGISFEKGGASVLADAFLVKGNLSREEALFFFGFGIVLQLIDDLQDVKVDLRNQHRTVFSQSARQWPLDKIANRLCDLMSIVLDSDCFSRADSPEDLRTMIRHNCQLLMVQATIENREFFSPEHLRNIEPYSPYRFRYWKKIGKKIQKEYRSFKEKSGKSSDEALAMALEAWAGPSPEPFSTL